MQVGAEQPGVPVEASEAIEAIFRRDYARLVRLATVLVDEPAAAEEVVQDAFVRLHLHWRRMRDTDRAAAWLRTVVVNGSRSRLRRRSVARRHLQAVAEPASAPDDPAVLADEHRRMLDALATLPTRQREALVLRFYGELSEAETAAAMGVSAGSVKTHVHRGLAALEKLVEDGR